MSEQLWAARLKDEVRRVLTALELIATSDNILKSFGDGYKKIGINYSLEACEIAAKISGADPLFCKMLNHQFRAHACSLMFERALGEARE